jgi:hypothetical protein
MPAKFKGIEIEIRTVVVTASLATKPYAIGGISFVFLVFLRYVPAAPAVSRLREPRMLMLGRRCPTGCAGNVREERRRTVVSTGSSRR